MIEAGARRGARRSGAGGSVAVIAEGGTVTEVAGRRGVSRQSVHGWLARYEAGGLDGLADRSHRPRGCPHQMSPPVAGDPDGPRADPAGVRRAAAALAQFGVRQQILTDNGKVPGQPDTSAPPRSAPS